MHVLIKLLCKNPLLKPNFHWKPTFENRLLPKSANASTFQEVHAVIVKEPHGPLENVQLYAGIGIFSMRSIFISWVSRKTLALPSLVIKFRSQKLEKYPTWFEVN